ncbi:MAG: hypothetical protein JEZ06_13075 [Anaerolineaceae bacterium]|nr:hypothetical protein [Anaerolineaceae bacterium]
MPIDLLILDEPTNNLDIDSIEEIEVVLQDFSGAILTISHDLSFLRNIYVNRAFVIHGGIFRPMKYEVKELEAFQREILDYL